MKITKAATDAQGFPIHGSTTHEPWPLSGDLLRTLYPNNTRDEGHVPNWCDHPRIEREQHNPTRYVCHPYMLSADAFRDFVTLTESGWRVHVTGQSVHYPGATVRVEIWKEHA